MALFVGHPGADEVPPGVQLREVPQVSGGGREKWGLVTRLHLTADTPRTEGPSLVHRQPLQSKASSAAGAAVPEPRTWAACTAELCAARPRTWCRKHRFLLRPPSVAPSVDRRPSVCAGGPGVSPPLRRTPVPLEEGPACITSFSLESLLEAPIPPHSRSWGCGAVRVSTQAFGGRSAAPNMTPASCSSGQDDRVRRGGAWARARERRGPRPRSWPALPGTAARRPVQARARTAAKSPGPYRLTGPTRAAPQTGRCEGRPPARRHSQQRQRLQPPWAFHRQLGVSRRLSLE